MPALRRAMKQRIETTDQCPQALKYEILVALKPGHVLCRLFEILRLKKFKFCTNPPRASFNAAMQILTFPGKGPSQLKIER
jgi:hypothetical protein